MKQSGRSWNSILHNRLIENNFHVFYINSVSSKLIVILVWVDDLIIGASNDLLMHDTREILKDRFHMKNLEKLTYFLGILFEQGTDYVKMNQKIYLTKLLTRFEMCDCKSRPAPSELRLEWGSEDFTDPSKYRELVGSLIYTMTCTRPDIC